MKYPPMAIASLLHRISGLILFLLLPIILFGLGQSFQSEETFVHVKDALSHPGYKIVLWMFSAAMIYHLLAGIRHLLMDAGLGEQLESGRRTAVLVLVLAVILIISLGIWIW